MNALEDDLAASGKFRVIVPACRPDPCSRPSGSELLKAAYAAPALRTFDVPAAAARAEQTPHSTRQVYFSATDASNVPVLKRGVLPPEYASKGLPSSRRKPRLSSSILDSALRLTRI